MADELTYDALVSEARTLIPVLHPGWTDHNPSDPGIVLVELFAYLTEILAFQVDEVPDTHTWSFLSLLNGPAWRPPADPGADDLGAAVAAALRELERRHRAVTTADYEHLLLHEWAGAAGLTRVHGVAARDLTRPAETAGAEAAGHVSVIVVPARSDDEPRPSPSAELIAEVAAFLEPRRLVTTRLHVVGPAYVGVTIGARLGLRADAPPDQALASAVAALRAAFDPFAGGGRDFGSPVYLSEVFAVLDGQPLVDYAEAVTLDGGVPVIAEDDTVSAIDLAPHELAVVSRIDLIAYDRYGRDHSLTWTDPR